MAGIHFSVGGRGLLTLLSVGAVVVLGGAVAYVLAEVSRARRRRQPVGPAARQAVRAAAVPVGAAMVALSAIAVAVGLLAFLTLYLVLAAIVAAVSGSARSLVGIIVGLAISLFVMVVLAAAALALGATSVIRSWLRRRRGGPGPG